MADDEFAPDALAPGPDEPGGGRVLIGILGESANADNVLLYLDLELRKRYEIPKKKIFRRRTLPAPQSPLGVDASMVWVLPDTVLTLQLNEPRHVENEFLAGDFTAPGSFTPTDAAARSFAPPRAPCLTRDFCYGTNFDGCTRYFCLR